MKKKNVVGQLRFLCRLFLLGCIMVVAGRWAGSETVAYAQEPSRRVNIPHFAGNVAWEQTAIFWFGKNEEGVPSQNYVDVRAAYTDWSLQIQVTVIDYYLWYNNSPTPAIDLTQYDAVAVYLDTNYDRASSPQTDDYRFLVGTRHWQDMSNYLRQAQGSGTDWNTGWVPSPNWTGSSGMSWSCDPGPNSNACGLDYGWTAILVIPWTTLDLSGPPPEGTLLGLGVQLYDRDDEPPAGYVAPEFWPETFDVNNPATWGELHLGYADYQSPLTTPEGTTVIRAASPVDNTVEDAWMGGGSTGSGGVFGGSELNHGDDPSLFVGSETAPTHFPFFNKSYLRFSLEDIPPGKKIISATLTLHHWGNSGQQSGLAEQSWVSLFTISDPWDEMTIHWNNAPLAQENIAATWINPLTAFPGWPGIPYDWDATQAVAEAYQAGKPVSLAIYSSDDARDTTKYLTASETGINDPPAYWNWNEEGRPTLTVLWGEPAGDDFTLDVSPSAQVIEVGGGATYTVRVQPTGDFSSTATLTVGNASPNLVPILVPTVVTPPAQSMLTVIDTNSGAGRWYSIPITGTSSNGIVHVTQVNLLVGGTRVYLPLITKK